MLQVQFNKSAPFEITSRRQRSLFAVLKSPDIVETLSTQQHDRYTDEGYYRTYLYHQQGNNVRITFIRSYDTLSSAITGHSRYRRKLWGY